MTQTDIDAVRDMAEVDVGTRDLDEAVRRYAVYEWYRCDRGLGCPASVIIGKPFVEDAAAQVLSEMTGQPVDEFEPPEDAEYPHPDSLESVDSG